MKGKLRGARGRYALWPVLAAGTLMTGSCDFPFGSNTAAFADNARVIVEGTSAAPLLLITSTEFVTTQDPLSDDVLTNLIVSDTAMLSALPGDRSFVIRGADRFLARVANSDTATTATIHMRVLLDGKEVFNQRATMRDASLEYTVFYRN